MKQYAMNPYLPLYEYIPDGEPRIFEGRLYVYGSHDYAGGEKGFCPGDYMIWSAPLNDLTDWRCDGVGFPRSECPGLDAADAMAAPDVVCGPDGRYYMYWNTNGQKVCHVAVSESPSGPFHYYGTVRTPDGRPYESYKMFDPGVLVDGERVYLFTGFCMTGPVPEQYKHLPSPFAQTSIGFELEKDMLTIKSGPVPVIPGGNVTEGTGFEGHGFYEASSPRKINEKYVMVYSSELSHELAYAISDHPLGPYHYEGALISNADFGLNGNQTQVMPYGNVHGGLVKLNGSWYVFYHRQTHATECSRQGCAEKLPIREDGWFGQAEITSCGLNDGALPASGSYQACYCCHLTAPQISEERLNPREHRRAAEPHIFEEPTGLDEKDYLHYIANIQNGTIVGYKYFSWKSPKQLELKLRGCGNVTVTARLDHPSGEVIGKQSTALQGEWETLTMDLKPMEGVHALYFCFEAEKVQFMEFMFR